MWPSVLSQGHSYFCFSAEDTSPALQRALRRIVPNPRWPCWILEKSWALNPSQSKFLTLGLDLSRCCRVVACISGNKGVQVVLAADELQELLSPAWLKNVAHHFRSPVLPGAVRVLPSQAEFRCVVIGDGEPGLRVSRISGDMNKSAFTILGDVTVKTMMMLAPRYNRQSFCAAI